MCGDLRYSSQKSGHVEVRCSYRHEKLQIPLGSFLPPFLGSGVSLRAAPQRESVS